MSITDIPLTPPAAEYMAPLDTLAPGFSGAVAQSQVNGESWVDTALRVLPVLATTYAQRQVINAQINQARNGLPPLDLSTLAPQVNVGIAGDTKTLLIGGALLLAAVLVVPKLMRR